MVEQLEDYDGLDDVLRVSKADYKTMQDTYRASKDGYVVATQPKKKAFLKKRRAPKGMWIEWSVVMSAGAPPWVEGRL